jgi:hypothetical protein
MPSSGQIVRSACRLGHRARTPRARRRPGTLWRASHHPPALWRTGDPVRAGSDSDASLEARRSPSPTPPWNWTVRARPSPVLLQFNCMVSDLGLCDQLRRLVVLVDHATEDLSPSDRQVPRRASLAVLVGRSLLAGLGAGGGRCNGWRTRRGLTQVSFVLDQQPVGALGSCAAYPSLGVAVCARCPGRGLDWPGDAWTMRPRTWRSPRPTPRPHRRPAGAACGWRSRH